MKLSLRGWASLVLVAVAALTFLVTCGQTEKLDAEAYVYRGISAYDRGDLDQAIANYDQAIALDPQFAIAYNNRGNAYYYKGDLDQAIADCDQAIALDPQYAAAYNNRGLAYYDQGNLDQAIADFERALDLALSPDLKQYVEEKLEELGR